MMRLLPLIALAVATPLAAQQLARPQVDRRAPWLGGQGPTIVAEPVALALAAFDADQDTLLTRAEATAGAARSFATVANGAADVGYIGYASWCARYLGDPNAAPGPFEVDTDRNNRISQSELTAALLGAFGRFDTNRDGTLTRAELVTVRATAFGDTGRKPKKAPPPRQ